MRGGAHLAALQQLVADVFRDLGYAESQILANRRATVLPGYFRATKEWDLLVVDNDCLVAGFELKSLAGGNDRQSWGRNFNNRIEEAVGSATDLWHAFEVGSLGPTRPWLGYLYVIEDSPESRQPRPARQPNLPVEPVFTNASYCERAGLMCERLLASGLYDAVCFVASSQDPAVAPREPIPSLSWDAFVEAIQVRVALVRGTTTRRR